MLWEAKFSRPGFYMAITSPFSKISSGRTCRMVLHGWRENRLEAYCSKARRVFFLLAGVLG